MGAACWKQPAVAQSHERRITDMRLRPHRRLLLLSVVVSPDDVSRMTSPVMQTTRRHQPYLGTVIIRAKAPTAEATAITTKGTTGEGRSPRLLVKLVT